MSDLFGGKAHYVQEDILEASTLKNITLTSWIRKLCFEWSVQFPNSPQPEVSWEIQFLKVFSQSNNILNFIVEVLGKPGIFYS